MMQIRREQMDALREAMLARFRLRMLVHLRSVASAENRELTDVALQETIKTGMQRASAYGIVDEMDIQRYLEFMVRYGADFDTDPATAWAGEILENPDLPDAERMNALEDYESIQLSRQHE
jgi:hypothetical protein